MDWLTSHSSLHTLAAAFCEHPIDFFFLPHFYINFFTLFMIPFWTLTAFNHTTMFWHATAAKYKNYHGSFYNVSRNFSSIRKGKWLLRRIIALYNTSQMCPQFSLFVSPFHWYFSVTKRCSKCRPQSVEPLCLTTSMISIVMLFFWLWTILQIWLTVFELILSCTLSNTWIWPIIDTL